MGVVRSGREPGAVEAYLRGWYHFAASYTTIVTIVLLLYLAVWATISLNTLHFTYAV